MKAEPPCLFGDSSWFQEASSPTLRASAWLLGLRRSSGAVLTVLIITLACPGELCKLSQGRSPTSSEERFVLFFFLFLALFAHGLVGLAGLTKASLGTLQSVLVPTDQVADHQLDSLCSLKAKGVFLQWRKQQFAISLGNTCNSCWGCPGGQAAKPGWEQGWFSILPTPEPRRLGNLSMGAKLRTIYFWQFAWTGELRLVFKNKSKKSGFRLLEKSFKCTKWFCNYLYLAELIMFRERKFRSQGNNSTCKSPGTDDHTYFWNAFNQRKWLTRGAAWQIAQYLTKQSPLELVHFHGNQNVAARGKWKFCKNSHPCYPLFHLEKFSIRIQRTQRKEITERVLLGKYHFICKGKMSLLNFHSLPSENFKLLQR